MYIHSKFLIYLIKNKLLFQEFDPSWRLPIGLYLQSTYRFRVQARTVVSDTVSLLKYRFFLKYLHVFVQSMQIEIRLKNICILH